MKVSFDFDETLTEESVWQYARDLIKRGIDVWIVTARLDDEHVKKRFGKFSKSIGVELPPGVGNEELWEMADLLEIPKDQIVFTNLKGKGKFFNENPDFEWHLDDSTKQLFDIQFQSPVIPINVLNPYWKSKCESILEKSDKFNYLETQEYKQNL